MNFKISTKTLNTAIDNISKVINSTSLKPELNGIKIVVDYTQLIFIASDNNMSVQLNLNIDENRDIQIINIGTVLINRNLIDLFHRINSEYVEFEIIDGNLMKISSDNLVTEVSCFDVNEYPIIDFTQPEITFKLENNLLNKIIRQTAFCASDKENRPTLTGINFKANDNMLTVTCTDGYRLAKKVVNIDFSNNFDVTIPADSLNKIDRIINDDQVLTFSLNNNKLQIIKDNYIIQTRLIDGKYPETSSFIANNFDKKLVIDSKELSNAISSSLFIKRDGMSIVTLYLSSNEVILTSNNDENSIKVNLTNFEYEGDPFTVTFSSKYALQALSGLSSSTVIFNFISTFKPFIIKPMDDTTILQLILPVKTK
ncbi:MAG: DNA polymerase III subunit beta [Erysipelotrichaceae bacterium]